MREALKTGHWSKYPKAYELVSHEVACIGRVVLRGMTIVVSRKLRKRVLDLVYEAHQGIVKTQERLRSKVWCPGIDKEAEEKCRECVGCQMVSKHAPPPSIIEAYEIAWESLARDCSWFAWALTYWRGPTCGGRLLFKMNGSRRTSLYIKCCSHRMLRQPFCNVWRASWFGNS